MICALAQFRNPRRAIALPRRAAAIALAAGCSLSGLLLAGASPAHAEVPSTQALAVNSVPAVTTQPFSATVTAPAHASFTVACTGTPAPSVQWQLSFDGGSSWNAIPGQTSTTLTVSPTVPSLSGTSYRAVCINVAGSVSSSAATLTVDGAILAAAGPAGSLSPARVLNMRRSSRSAPATRPAGVVISLGSATVDARGHAVIQLLCPVAASGGCRGTVTLRLAGPHARRARALAARCGRGCRSLGSAKYEARAGQMVRIRIHIASYRRRFAHRRALRVALSATNVSGGKTSTTELTITLKSHARRTSA